VGRRTGAIVAIVALDEFAATVATCFDKLSDVKFGVGHGVSIPGEDRRVLVGLAQDTRRKPLIRFLRVLLAMPAVLVGAVVAFYLVLLGWGMLIRVRWVSDRTRQLSKRGNPYLLKIAGTRLRMLYFNLSYPR
jgi:hypothetical protein